MNYPPIVMVMRVNSEKSISNLSQNYDKDHSASVSQNAKSDQQNTQDLRLQGLRIFANQASNVYEVA